MWVIDNKSIPKERFEPFRPIDVLDDYDGPRIFTLCDSEGELNLAYWCDEDSQKARYVVVPTTLEIVDSLRRGDISVSDALNQPRCYLCDTTHQGELSACLRVKFDEVPYDCLPSVGTMLYPALEPLLTLKAVGPDIIPGQVPGSVILACVEGVQRTFKFLSEYVLERRPQPGRPDDFLRKLFDLPTQRVAFASFEISFRMPIEEDDLFTLAGAKSPAAQTLDEVGELLNKGLNWLSSSAADEGVFPTNTSEEAAVLLRALKELTPSSQGSIDRMELKGRLLGQRVLPVHLDRSARQRVNNAIRSQSLEPVVVDVEGVINELDKFRSSCEVRAPDGSLLGRFWFDDSLREDIYQAFIEEWTVKIAGLKYPGKESAWASLLSRTTTVPIGESPNG